MDRNKAIEIIKSQCPANKQLVDALEFLVPELKESYDEKIREAIINHLKEDIEIECILSKDEGYEWIAWLEKQGQGEQRVKPKFKDRDWVIDKQNIVHQISNVVENVTTHSYGYDIVGGGYFNDKTEGIRLWTIQDAKDGDVLVASDGSIFLFKCTIDCGCKHYVALTNTDVVKINEGLEHCWEISTAVNPATKEQRDLLFQKILEAGYEWDAEKKELVKL